MMGLFSAIRRLFGRPTPTPPPYTPRPAATVIGINIHRGGQQEMDMLQDLGTKHARITMWLQEWDKPNRVAAWHAMLTHFDYIGVEPLLVLHMSTRRDWAKAAAEFKGRTWQLGNEVDATSMSAEAYVAEVLTATRMMLTVDPTAKFVASGLARTDGQGTHDTSDMARWTEWASALMTLPEGALRAICLHAYTDYTLPISALVQAVNNVVRGRVPLWITEFGPIQHGGPNGIVPDDEALLIVRPYRHHLPAWGVERVYWYCLNDGMDFAHGLVRADDTKRPGYYAVKWWIGGGGVIDEASSTTTWQTIVEQYRERAKRDDARIEELAQRANHWHDTAQMLKRQRDTAEEERDGWKIRAMKAEQGRQVNRDLLIIAEGQRDEWKIRAIKVEQERQALWDKCDALREDAARYRWLKPQLEMDWDVGNPVYLSLSLTVEVPTHVEVSFDLDATIDAALAVRPTTGEEA